MATFQSIRELTRALHQGSKLLYDMFQKRKTVSIRYDDAVETLDGNEDRLKYLINFGVVVRVGDLLELDDAYQHFFEEVLAVNEEINIASVKTYIDSLNLKINSCLVAETNRKPLFVREIRHIFRSINNATNRNAIDLKRNVDQTYKQEPNFKIKELRLKDFDEKCRLIGELIKQTENVMDRQTIFFSSMMDVGLKQTVEEVREGLKGAAHSLIATKAQIIDYLNRIEYQSRMVRKVRQLKYLRDQFMIAESTDIKEIMNRNHAVWMEKRPRYTTKVSLDFLRNDDAALDILSDVRRRLSKNTLIKKKLAARIDKRYLEEIKETGDVVNHQEMIDAFTAQGGDLFSYVWNYTFGNEKSVEQRLVIFLQLASQYSDRLEFTSKTAVKDKYEYPLIFPL